jgi:hypothetical protein
VRPVLNEADLGGAVWREGTLGTWFPGEVVLSPAFLTLKPE